MIEFGEMGSKICMNELCRSTTSSEWKKGWGLRSGGFATLCYNCGSAYEKLNFCETFHAEESGWRECRMCGKRIHCGCIVSKYLYEFMDFGGIGCISCIKLLETRHISPVQIPNNVPNGNSTRNCIKDVLPFVVQNRVDESNYDKGRLTLLSEPLMETDPVQLLLSQTDGVTETLEQIKREETRNVPVESALFPSTNQPLIESSTFVKPNNLGPKHGANDMFESLAQPSLTFSLNSPSGTSSCTPPTPGTVVEGREQKKVQRARNMMPKSSKPSNSRADANKGMASHRIARPPAEGRGGRNQLLPRYWPRITDQELLKLSGDLNSTIVPLFEKVLSASDAGRIGRLVLPKACAEAYFPSINQSEGIPIRIQDIQGKDWTFQFRFWPNNNSRMYVLEGITPCIQNMHLQAGDTVTFSRIDPGGKLVMGFRKTTNNVNAQDTNASTANGGSSGETSYSEVKESLADGGRISEDSLQRNAPVPEKKKARNIGSKNKRLLMHSEDAVELRITWEEAQDLLRPPPTVKPTVVVIEDQEFEEYDEPPVIGKRTIFTNSFSGEHEQWAQCDHCSKWRKLPVHVLLPANWTCSENIWDAKRSSCSAPDEINLKAMDNFLRSNDHSPFKRPRIAENNVADDREPSALDALATVAVLGDNMAGLEEPSASARTKHPRHRPGCTCIVCLQPPSGKGKHQPNCKCNVCSMVRRRFKTLMQRRKKRQSEREAELAEEKDQVSPSRESEREETLQHVPLRGNPSEAEGTDPSKEHLDLNSQPDREEEMLTEPAETGGASRSLDIGLEQNGLANSRPCLISGESGVRPSDEGDSTSPGEEQENKIDDG